MTMNNMQHSLALAASGARKQTACPQKLSSTDMYIDVQLQIYYIRSAAPLAKLPAAGLIGIRKHSAIPGYVALAGYVGCLSTLMQVNIE
jgi:hypothetical protein